MNRGIRFVALVAAVGLWTNADLLACGDKFLVAGRGTRYARPKNARAASVLIYATPASGLPAALKSVSLESLLKHGGHRATTVETPEQLSAILEGGRFDVILAASGDAPAVEERLRRVPDAAVVVAFCLKAGVQEPGVGSKSVTCTLEAPPKESKLLEAIDRAVERRDQNARKAQART